MANREGVPGSLPFAWWGFVAQRMRRDASGAGQGAPSNADFGVAIDLAQRYQREVVRPSGGYSLAVSSSQWGLPGGWFVFLERERALWADCLAVRSTVGEISPALQVLADQELRALDLALKLSEDFAHWVDQSQRAQVSA